MSDDIRRQLEELVNLAIKDRLAGVKNELAGIRTDLTGRIEELANSLSSAAAQVPTHKLEELLHMAQAAPGTGSVAAHADYSGLKEHARLIERGTSQVSILQDLLECASAYCRRCALFVVREQNRNMVGWAARGFTGCGDIHNEAIKKVTVAFDSKTVLNAVIDSGTSYNGGSDRHEDNIQLFEMLGSLDPVEIVAVPLMKSGKVAAVFYGDSGDSQEGLESADCAELLVGVTGMSIDLIPLKQKLGMPAPARPAARVSPPAPEARTQAPVSPPPKPSAQTPETFQAEFQAEVNIPVTPASTRAEPEAAARAGEGMSSDDRKIHEEAKRFARLLVSEIKLYNEAKLVEGRKHKDIYSRMKEDIDKSRQMFKERYPDISSSTDYFARELTATLAEGDASLLGM